MKVNLMRSIPITVIGFIAFCCISCTNVKTNLYHAEDNYKAKPGEGIDLIMTCDELERHEKYSIVKVRRTSGGATATIMFMVKCSYEIAKIRGDLFFTDLKEWDDKEGNWYYKVGFSKDDKIDLKTYYGEDIKQKIDPFMSVQRLDMMWGKKK